MLISTLSPQLEIGNKHVFDFTLEVSGYNATILAHLDLQTKLKILSTSEVFQNSNVKDQNY